MNFRIVFRNSLSLELNRILYIDRAFVVVNKPPNFVTQYPGDGQTDAVAELVGKSRTMFSKPIHPHKHY